jgi:ATP-binding cassette subfamily F protein 3
MQRLAAAMPSAPARQNESAGGNTKDRRRNDAQRRQEKNGTLKPMREKLAKAEAEIAGFETEKAALAAMMGSPGFGEDAGVVRETTSRYADVEASLARAYSQWSDVSEEVERLEKEFGDD